MAEPMKPRAWTCTEMMNGGRQQLDEAEHAREQELQQRVEDLEKDVDRLEQALVIQGFNSIPLDRVLSWLSSGRGCPQRGALLPTCL